MKSIQECFSDSQSLRECIVRGRVDEGLKEFIDVLKPEGVPLSPVETIRPFFSITQQTLRRVHFESCFWKYSKNDRFNFRL